MKALIVGLGSMGKRRIRLLKGIDPSIEIIGVDTWDERRAQVEEMGHKTFASIADAAAILQYIANPDKYELSENGMKAADVVGNGNGITADDAIAIQKLDAKLIEDFSELE